MASMLATLYNDNSGVQTRFPHLDFLILIFCCSRAWVDTIPPKINYVAICSRSNPRMT